MRRLVMFLAVCFPLLIAAPAVGWAASGPAAWAAPGATVAARTGVGDTLTLDGAFSGEQLAVTPLSVIDPAQPATQFDQPASGRLVAVELRVDNTGSVNSADSPFNCAVLIDAGGQGYAPSVANSTAGLSFPGDMDLHPGESLSGFVVFNLPDGAVIAQLQFTLNGGHGPQTGTWEIWPTAGQPAPVQPEPTPPFMPAPQPTGPFGPVLPPQGAPTGPAQTYAPAPPQPPGPTQPPAPTGSPAPAPSGSASVVTPITVVQHYYAALNAQNYQLAWNLGGKNLGLPFPLYQAAYSATSHLELTVDYVTGDQVGVRVDATLQDGSHYKMIGTYTVQNGQIVASDLRPA